MTRICYACGSDKTVQYRQPYGNREYELWYKNKPTKLVLCNRCYNYYIKAPKYRNLTPPGGLDYWRLHKWVRENRPKPPICELCHDNSPKQVANVDGRYEQDISHFRFIISDRHKDT